VQRRRCRPRHADDQERALDRDVVEIGMAREARLGMEPPLQAGHDLVTNRAAPGARQARLGLGRREQAVESLPILVGPEIPKAGLDACALDQSVDAAREQLTSVAFD
jgi:hypothetical protein